MEEGLETRSMKLKVLYTFDAEHKNNHLARWPESLDVQTAFVDESNQIGVVSLKTCVGAITTASPEIAAKIDLDYAIYAFDYSEEDTPLVGQGLLSKVLNGVGEDADEETELVTGRVTRNILGLFKKSAQETLEVKLRLTPVPRATPLPQNPPSRHQRTQSGTFQDFNAQAWSNEQVGHLQLNIPQNYTSRPASPMDHGGIEAMQRMMSEGLSPRQTKTQLPTDSYFSRGGSRPPSRNGSVLHKQTQPAPTFQQENFGLVSEPRGDNTMIVQPASRARRDSFNSGYFSGDEAIEEGPARKRAKVTQVNNLGKSNLNIERQPDSLRVAASGAQSVRIHRPVALNPALALEMGNPTEEPVRPPTPVATRRQQPTSRKGVAPSNLRSGSAAQLFTTATSQSRQNQPLEIQMTSPEDYRPKSSQSTPANIPSSPPVMETHSTPSSPALPRLPNDNDSGFMSGGMNDFLANDLNIFDDFLVDKPDDLGDSQILLQESFAPVFDEGQEVGENTPPELPPPPPKAATRPELAKQRGRTQSARPIGRAGVSSPQLAPATVSRSQMPVSFLGPISMAPPVQPTHNGSLPAYQPPPPMHRANTWTPDMSDALTSDAAVAEDGTRKSILQSRKRVGKEQTKARLEAAIASGELPPYCDNCGTIDTPAWRRVFAKTFHEGYENFTLDGQALFTKIEKEAPDGKILEFRAFKQSKSKEDADDEWVTVTLCNPCGLWFGKQNCMRPESKWNKNPKDPKEKRKRPSRPRSQRNRKGASNSSKTDATSPASDATSPAGTVAEGGEADAETVVDADESQQSGGETGNQQSKRKRANSASGLVEPSSIPIDPALTAPVPKLFHSSPIQPQGEKETPIGTCPTPKPLRRLLFSPSGRQLSAESAEKLPAILKELKNLPAFVRRSPRINKIHDVMETEEHVNPETQDKENQTQEQQNLNDLFGDNNDDPLPPATPTPNRTTNVVFKTPSRLDKDGSPVALRKTPGGRHPLAAALLGTHQNPEEMTPFTWSIHNMLSDVPEAKTPDRSSPYNLRVTPRRSTQRQAKDLDFPDLPSLPGNSPSNSNDVGVFAFSELTTDQLQTDFGDILSTDMQIPSSPPPGFFTFPETHDGDIEIDWAEMGIDINFGNSPAKAMPQPDEHNPHAPRRSPRKKVA